MIKTEVGDRVKKLGVGHPFVQTHSAVLRAYSCPRLREDKLRQGVGLSCFTIE